MIRLAIIHASLKREKFALLKRKTRIPAGSAPPKQRVWFRIKRCENAKLEGHNDKVRERKRDKSARGKGDAVSLDTLVSAKRSVASTTNTLVRARARATSYRRRVQCIKHKVRISCIHS